MKIVMRNVSVLVVVVALLATAVSSAALVDYQFNDDAGTDWKSVAQTGTDASQWNFNTPQAKTDGLGNAHFAGVPVEKNNMTRKNVLATPLTSGIVSLEYQINAWDVSNSEGNIGLRFSFGDDLKLKFEGTTNDAGRKNIKFSSMGSVTDSKTLYDKGPGANWNLILRAEVDLDNDTYDTMWRRNYETEWTALTTGGTFANDIAELKMVISAPVTWDAADFIDIDYVTVDTVPEPATLALLGLGALVSFRRKRA